ncbi:MAG: hypothetical protein KJ955_08840 [Nanoarchaeota archaeon]|nr:hypothetical protein [Nanoarchaeota archaeon]
MEHIIRGSDIFYEQAKSLSDKSKKIVEEKLNLLKINPYRNKRIHYKGLFLFRIRFEDKNKEKRIIYFVDKPYVKILCILERGKEYKDLKRFLRRCGAL